MSNTRRNSGGGPGAAWPLLFWLPLILTAALLLSGCAAQTSQGEQSPPAEDQAAGSQTGGASDGEQASRGELGHPALGDTGAPVVMVEYADYQ